MTRSLALLAIVVTICIAPSVVWPQAVLASAAGSDGNAGEEILTAGPIFGSSDSVALDSESETAAQATQTRGWWERIRLTGDFRSRYEGFYQSGRQISNRVRMRLRLRLDSQIND